LHQLRRTTLHLQLLSRLVVDDPGTATATAAAAAQSVYGKAEPGDMLALMGPSGAGKSTLMDILAGRKSVGNLTGSVLVNGMPRKKDEFARKTAYVPQVGAATQCVVCRDLCCVWPASSKHDA
jgi:ABC-type multidrug transport system ATPase subunit